MRHPETHWCLIVAGCCVILGCAVRQPTAGPDDVTVVLDDADHRHAATGSLPGTGTRCTASSPSRRHTLGDVTFELPDDVESSEYFYELPPQAALTLASADDEPGDAQALLEMGRSHLDAFGAPLLRATFVRGDGSSVPGFAGQKPFLDPQLQQFALAAIASPRAKAVAMYMGPAGPDALRLFQQVMANAFVVGEAGTEARSVPPGWTRRQAGRILLALPREWKDPKALTFGFGSGAEIKITLTEPLAPEGVIDLSSDRAIDRPETVERVATEIVMAPGIAGWTGEWRLSGGNLKPGEEKTVHKMSATVGGKTTFTAHGRAERKYAARLEKAWAMLQCSLRAATATDG